VTAKDAHELIFVKNEKGEMTAVMMRSPGWPDREGKKLQNE
jgi:hypothetical protein